MRFQDAVLFGLSSRRSRARDQSHWHRPQSAQSLAQATESACTCTGATEWQDHGHWHWSLWPALWAPLRASCLGEEERGGGG